MGRHSKPDPEDSADESPQKPQDSIYDYPGEQEPDYGSGLGEPGYRGSDYRSGYPARESEHREPGADENDHHEPEYGADYRRAEFADHDYPEPETRASAPPPAPPPPSGPQHGVHEGGEWTGSHRAVAGGRRGVSVGVIAALIAVVVVVGTIILWQFFGDALSNRSEAAAARCVAGELAVAVIADPTIAEQVQTLASHYNETADPVGDRCVKVGVKPAESDQVVNGFVSYWPTDLGDRPTLWIPASGVSEARLEAAAGAQTVSDSRSLVTSPVLLAVRPELKEALTEQNWGALPGLQTKPTGLDELSLPGWGSLKLALPLTGDSDASYLAAEAVAAATAPAGAAPSVGMGAVNTMTAGQPKLADPQLSTAMEALVNAADPAAAPVHAVVTTEQQLFQRGESLPDAKNTVTSWLPPGPTAMADYPTVLLSGDWLSQEQVTAASEFARFMRKPEQLAELAKAGFRTAGGTPPQSEVTSFAPVSAPLSIGDNATRATLANVLTTPTEGSTVTIMLDQSMTTPEGTNTRMGNAVNALIPRIGALPSSAAVGLWTFDGAEGTLRVTTGPLSEPVGGEPRSTALTTTLDSLSSRSGGAVSFTTLRLVYNEAMANFREGQSNSVLLITAGPHTDQSLDGDSLQAFIRDAFDPARPVAVSVVDFGNDSDRATWEAIAEASGGNYKNLASSASPELTTAVTKFLS